VEIDLDLEKRAVKMGADEEGMIYAFVVDDPSIRVTDKTHLDVIRRMREVIREQEAE